MCAAYFVSTPRVSISCGFKRAIRHVWRSPHGRGRVVRCVSVLGRANRAAFANVTSVVPGRFINGNYVKRADRVRDSLLVYNHHDFRMDRDEILVRHTDLLAIREFQSERVKTILRTASDLPDYHGAKLSLRVLESILQLHPASVAAPSEALVTCAAYLARAPRV
jgi:hypothetical protein